MHPIEMGAPARVRDRETLIVGFDTDPAALRALLPWSLVPDGSNAALAEFAAVPDPAGGSRTEFNLLVPALFGAERVLFCAWSAGNEAARVRLVIVHDTLTGIVERHGRAIALGAMNYRRADTLERRQRFAALAPADALRQLRPTRVIAQSSLTARARPIAQPWRGIRVQCAWTGPATLDLLAHEARLPVLAVHGGLHCVIDYAVAAARRLTAAVSPVLEPARSVSLLAVEGGIQ